MEQDHATVLGTPTPTPDVDSSIARTKSAVGLRERQRELMKHYRSAPDDALVVDSATTHAENSVDEGPLDPLHTWVDVGASHPVRLPAAVHHAVGGLSDLPVPGDLLCAALAGCTDSALRVVANALDVRLQSLSVDVRGEVDVRGALFVDPDVPVGFQHFHVQIFLRAAPKTDPARLRRLVATAERSCVVMQTLRAGVAVTVEHDLGVLPYCD